MKMHDAKTYLRASVLLAVAICCGSTLAHMGAAASTAPTTIWSFTGGNGDGANPYPYGHVVFDSNGALYGTTASGGSSSNGTVFQLVPPSVACAWTESVLYSFAGGAYGRQPAPVWCSAGMGHYTAQPITAETLQIAAEGAERCSNWRRRCSRAALGPTPCSILFKEARTYRIPETWCSAQMVCCMV